MYKGYRSGIKGTDLLYFVVLYGIFKNIQKTGRDIISINIMDEAGGKM